MAGEVRGVAGALVRFRNREIGESELDWLRRTIAESGWRTLTELSQIVCAAWDWRQPNGRFSEFACRELLLRLEQWGHLDLGVRRRGSRSGSAGLRSRLPTELIPIPEIPITDAEANLDELVVRPIGREERLGWRLYIDRYHYLGWRPVVGEHLLYAAYLDTELVALLGWGSAALHLPARERFVGWEEAAKRQHLHLVVNNGRFLVLPWVRVKCLASKVLATNLRRLSQDWEKVWGHGVWLAESFVDTARFAGTCYQASNWHYVGDSGGLAKRGNRYIRHGHPKAVYLYPLHRRWRQKLTALR